jgi:hypothetical protein
MSRRVSRWRSKWMTPNLRPKAFITPREVGKMVFTAMGGLC